jgi:hypothetical protein
MENNIEGYISDILKDMVLEEKNDVLTVHHGSRKDDDIEYTSYYDVHRHIWTTHEKAVEGYILNQLQPIISKLTKEKQ